MLSHNTSTIILYISRIQKKSYQAYINLSPVEYQAYINLSPLENVDRLTDDGCLAIV